LEKIIKFDEYFLMKKKITGETLDEER